MKVLITGSSKFPVPAVKGGAVPNLIEELIQEQQVENKIELDCCSLWNKDAEIAAKKYTKTKFIWVKIPSYINGLDYLITAVLKNIFKMNRLHSVGFLFQVIWFTFYIGKVLKNNNYDRVIFENSTPMLFAMKLYGNRKKYKDKYYIHMHSVPRRYYGNNRVFSNCLGLISISEYVANEIINDKRIAISKEKIRIMYNCIDTDIMVPKPKEDAIRIKSKYGIKSSEKIILFAGRLCKEKGVEEVIQMLKEMNNENVKLMVVGANFYSSGMVSSYEEYLRELAEPIKNKIVFTGYIPYKEMSYYYNAADVVILPSMWEEPAGMTIIEAMACKKPVITTKSGGIPEYTGKDSCILLDKSENLTDKLICSTNHILRDEKYAKLIANKCLNRAIKFNRPFYYQQFLNILTGDVMNEKV